MAEEVVPGNVEVLVFKLLDSSLECSVFVSERNELRVNFINRRGLRLDCLQSGLLSELGVALLHDALDLLRYLLFVFFSVAFENALYKLEPFSQSLVFNIELEAVAISILQVSMYLFNVVSEVGVGFE